jgi:hypothetical protein
MGHAFLILYCLNCTWVHFTSLWSSPGIACMLCFVIFACYSVSYKEPSYHQKCVYASVQPVFVLLWQFACLLQSSKPSQWHVSW